MSSRKANTSPLSAARASVTPKPLDFAMARTRSSSARPLSATKALPATFGGLALSALGALVALAALSGCGHPATKEECDQIFDKVVELELRGQNINDPAVVAQRKVETRNKLGADLGKKCEGRKMTDRTMACVRTATSYEDIENRCFR